jgi:hypothetical protein
MSRGPGGIRTKDINSARRRGSRRAAEARARREQRRRERAAERKHLRGLLKPAVRAARTKAREHGWEVRLERTKVSKGRWGRPSWTEAVIELPPSDVSIKFSVAGQKGSGSSNSIRVYAGRKLIRPCPSELLRSGDRRAFVAWLGEALTLAAERSQAGAG